MKNILLTVVLLIGIILICIACVFAITRTAYFPVFDLSKTGQIGDTIGGITSPILGIIGSWLVYLSFRQQFLANQLQQESLRKEVNERYISREFSQIENLFNLIKQDIINLEYSSLRQPKQSYIRKPTSDIEFEHYSVKGITSIVEFNSNLNFTYTSKIYKLYFLKQLNHILHQLKYIEQKIIRLDVPIVDKEYLEEIIKSYYQNILEPILIDLKANLEKTFGDNELFKDEFDKYKAFILYLATIFTLETNKNNDQNEDT
jgi:hypothetical protein